ncbi:hypothetical protein NQZ68_033177 [Dissostichus eleginoides]|nr:hypothetical protein NQZ68_033177 [Dissostichus eleginoides]
MEVNGTSSANTSGSSTLEVYEGRDVMLTFVMEAYPPIRSQHWTTTTLTNINNNVTGYKGSYGADGYRSEASLLLRRVRPEDGGQYSFHFENSFFNGSQNIDLQIYRKFPLSRFDDLSTCSNPLRWFFRFSKGLRQAGERIADLQQLRISITHNPLVHLHRAAGQESAANVTSQEEEVRLTLGTPADDVTAECVAYNKVGLSRQALHLHAAAVIFSPALIGCLSCAAVLLLLLLVISYKLRQKPRYEVRWKIIESSDGNNYTFFDPAQLPYNRKWEFPRDRLRLGVYSVG